MLKALDFVAAIGPNLKVRHVCRAQAGRGMTGTACSCGYAFPAKMWAQIEGRWKFKCQVKWSAIAKVTCRPDH